MTTDQELLRQYAQNANETAFTELMRRRVNLVYSTALRVAGGDCHLAEDVTQAVFAHLARCAYKLIEHPTLIGWMHKTAYYIGSRAMRAEQRRWAREQQAFLMQNDSTDREISWQQLLPVLDEAINRLSERDRDALLLRFFENMSHREIGDILGLNENSARRRGDRAIEKLRQYFGRRGIVASAALLSEVITANAVQAAPVDLVPKMAQASLASTGSLSVADILLKLFYMSTKNKILMTAALLLLLGLIFTIPRWWTKSVRVVASVAGATSSSPNIIEAPKLPAAQPGGSSTVPTSTPVRVPPGGSAISVAGESIKPVSMEATDEHTEVDLGRILLTPNVPVQIIMPSGETGTMMGNVGDDGLVHVYVDIPVPVPGGGSIMLHDESIGPKDKGMGRAVFGKENINISYSTALQDN